MLVENYNLALLLSYYIIMHTDITLNCRKLDADHAEVLRLLNRLHEKIGLRSISQSDLDGFQSELAEYANSHFAFEESLMLECGYSHSAGHIAEHAEFRTRVSEIFKSNHGGDPRSKALDVVLALNSWIRNHITKEDRKLVAFLKQQQIDPCN